MPKFQGYHTALRPYVSSLGEAEWFDHFDLRYMAKQNDRLSPAGVEPMCPLAAVGRTLLHMNPSQTMAFERGDLVIDVIDVARQTVETYDTEKVDFELELERIAG